MYTFTKILRALTSLQNVELDAFALTIILNNFSNQETKGLKSPTNINKAIIGTKYEILACKKQILLKQIYMF